MIKIKNLSKVFGQGESQIIALHQIDCEIEEGKFVALIGKSGSGKSTLLNIIGALEKPSEGDVEIDGVNLFSMTSNELADYRNKKLGYVFQSFYLEPEFSVLENVAMPLLIAGVNKKTREDKAKEYIEKLGLNTKTNEKVKNLSGGQKQRVAIARALVNDPSIILADEPTGNLDTANGQDVIKILREIADNKKTVIVVTHNMQDAKIADETIELQDGKIVNRNINV